MTMPPTLPDCTECDSAGTLKVIRADVRGLKWCYCDCCSATLLLDAENRVVHKSTA